MITESRKREIKVGAFVIIVAAITVATIVYVGVKKDLFSERAYYYVISTSGEGIEPGIAVRLKGFKIGQVRNVTLESINAVRSEIEILKKYVKWFKSDSSISLERPLIGGAYLDFTPGSPDSPVLSPGAQIVMEERENLQEQLQAKAESLLGQVDEVVANLSLLSNQIVDPEGPVQTILRNAQDLTDRLMSDEGMAAYLSGPEPARRLDAILANSEESTARLNDLLSNADERVADLSLVQEDVRQLISEVRENLAQFEGLREELNPILDDVAVITTNVREATTDLSSLRARGEYTLRLGGEVLQRLKETWPLNRGEDYLETPDHPMTPDFSEAPQ